ncbi:DUF2804 domain-containing protein [Oerskovia sp. NPDC060287]|uniref:DUF2804 domain-containing protein n=1 Tax=Oerskovia sp. NPDC060287 TaxID=3347095 RepID=UPI003667C7A5
MTTHEREITAPVDLCLPDGRLNPDAVGWTRTPLHRANLSGWGRTKRWEYWGVVTPSHVIGVVASSIDYAGVHGLYVLDRATGEETATDVVVPLARGVVMPETSGAGRAEARAKKLAILIDQDPAGTRIRAASHDVSLDLTIPLPPGHESLGVVVPWSDRLFQYTVKDVARPVSGSLTVHGTRHEVSAEDSFAVLDHGRGRWPYSMTWNWAAGSAHGRGIQLGDKWTDGTGSTENALLVDGRLHKIGQTLDWQYDRDDWLAPWRISGDEVEAVFTPFHEKVARTEMLVVGTETHQCFGTWSGRARTDEGTWVDLDGLVGWAEEAQQRW